MKKKRRKRHTPEQIVSKLRDTETDDIEKVSLSLHLSATVTICSQVTLRDANEFVRSIERFSRPTWRADDLRG